jgi:hypothetical protein
MLVVALSVAKGAVLVAAAEGSPHSDHNPVIVLEGFYPMPEGLRKGSGSWPSIVAALNEAES